MNRKFVAIGLSLMTAGVAFAHGGVQNPAVMARMDAMMSIADNMKTLGEMAKGTSAFDPGVARSAAAAIAESAAATPGLFEENETDPKSEARPEIWLNHADFTAKALELEALATGFANSITERSDLNAALGALGANCQSCHAAYRQ